METVHHNAYHEDPYAKEFGIKISEKRASVEACILPAPRLKYHDTGREKDCLPRYGVSPKRFEGDPALSSFFKILITSADTNDKWIRKAIIVNGQRRILISGSIHYPRSVPELRPGLIQKAKDGGLDVIQTYVFWNGHEPSSGKVFNALASLLGRLSAEILWDGRVFMCQMILPERCVPCL